MAARALHVIANRRDEPSGGEQRTVTPNWAAARVKLNPRATAWKKSRNASAFELRRINTPIGEPLRKRKPPTSVLHTCALVRLTTLATVWIWRAQSVWPTSRCHTRLFKQGALAPTIFPPDVRSYFHAL